MKKVHQRRFRIEVQSLSRELQWFATSACRFGSNAAVNDLWLEVEMGDVAFEAAVVHYIKGVLGRRYQRLELAPIRDHCREDAA